MNKKDILWPIAILVFLFCFAHVIVFLVPGNPNISNDYKDFLARFLSWVGFLAAIVIMLLLKGGGSGGSGAAQPERRAPQQPGFNQQQQQRQPQQSST